MGAMHQETNWFDLFVMEVYGNMRFRRIMRMDKDSFSNCYNFLKELVISFEAPISLVIEVEHLRRCATEAMWICSDRDL
ncbi:hypothetical protein R1flu_000026 [Riccia fluitans]|uniref:Uncharacterized protein n=1 Tax=Riccia fluitans TaxID=41844 RepID=A0ABD1XZ89_9MARC